MGAFFPDLECRLSGLPLVAYYKLDEASGTRVDSVNSYNLTDNNTVTQAVGKVANAAQFTAANTEYLNVASNSDLQAGNTDMSFVGWVYLDSKGTNRMMFAKSGDNGNAAADREYFLRFDNAVDQFNFFWHLDDLGSVANVQASTFGSPSLATWYMIFAYHSAAVNQIGISVNNGVIDTAAASGGNSGASRFTLGARSDAVVLWDGRIDEFLVFKGVVLNSQNVTDLYNAGNGNTYDPLDQCGIQRFRMIL